MEHSRKQKLLMIVALVLSIASISIGFAAFSTTLNISSSASVTPSSDTFSVKFSTNKDSLVVSSVAPSSITSGITATDGVIDNSTNPTITNLSATFTSPGQYVEYTIYARNEGEYTAYLNNINFLGDKTCIGETGTADSLVQSACESINITASIGSTTYSETTPIEEHTLSKGVGEEIIVRLEYAENGAFVDGPFKITFPSVSLVYSTIDDSSMSGEVVRMVSGDIDTIGSVVAIGNEQFYVFGQEDGNIKLLSMYNLYVGNSINISDEGKAITTTLTTTTGIQDSTAIGGFNDSEGAPAGFPWIGTTAFSNIDSTYSGSIVEGYVNNYASYLEGLGANIEEARLITKDELETLGCSSDDYTCSGTPEFIYKTSYWSETANDSNSVWFVYSNGGFTYYDNNYQNGNGVRPVIEIPVSEF